LFAIFKNNHKTGKRVLEKRIIPKENIIKNDTFFLPNGEGTPNKATPNSFLGKRALTHLQGEKVAGINGRSSFRIRGGCHPRERVLIKGGIAITAADPSADQVRWICRRKRGEKSRFERDHLQEQTCLPASPPYW
jgi:hypothetical protein